MQENKNPSLNTGIVPISPIFFNGGKWGVWKQIAFVVSIILLPLFLIYCIVFAVRKTNYAYQMYKYTKNSVPGLDPSSSSHTSSSDAHSQSTLVDKYTVKNNKEQQNTSTSGNLYPSSLTQTQTQGFFSSPSQPQAGAEAKTDEDSISFVIEVKLVKESNDSLPVIEKINFNNKEYKDYPIHNFLEALEAEANSISEKSIEELISKLPTVLPVKGKEVKECKFTPFYNSTETITDESKMICSPYLNKEGNFYFISESNYKVYLLKEAGPKIYEIARTQFLKKLPELLKNKDYSKIITVNIKVNIKDLFKRWILDITRCFTLTYKEIQELSPQPPVSPTSTTSSINSHK